MSKVSMMIWFLLYTAMFIFIGYAARVMHVEYKEIKEDEKQMCITMYRLDPISTLADSYCDEFFNVLRLENKEK